MKFFTVCLRGNGQTALYSSSVPEKIAEWNLCAVIRPWSDYYSAFKLMLLRKNIKLAVLKTEVAFKCLKVVASIITIDANLKKGWNMQYPNVLWENIPFHLLSHTFKALKLLSPLIFTNLYAVEKNTPKSSANAEMKIGHYKEKTKYQQLAYRRTAVLPIYYNMKAML